MTKAKTGSRLTAMLWVAAVLWVGVLFFLSTQTAVQSDELSGWFTSLVLRVFRFLKYDPSDLEGVLRKVAHFCIFAFEGFLLGLAMQRTIKKRTKALILTEAICMVMAAANEASQLFAAGRSCEVRDMLIDSGGALLGVFAAWALHAIVLAAVSDQRSVEWL